LREAPNVITPVSGTLDGREQIDGGFKVLDASGQALVYVYARDTREQADIAKVLTLDEARPVAVPGSLLLGVKRTSLIRALMSDNDPKRTSSGVVTSLRIGP
jgi:hypothetical protein